MFYNGCAGGHVLLVLLVCSVSVLQLTVKQLYETRFSNLLVDLLNTIDVILAILSSGTRWASHIRRY